MSNNREHMRDLILRRIPEGTRFVLDDLVDCMEDAYSAGFIKAREHAGELPRPWKVASRWVDKHSAVTVIEDAENALVLEVGSDADDDTLARRLVDVVNGMIPAPITEETEEYSFEYEGENIWIEEACLSKLLKDEVLHANSRKYICPYQGEQKETTLLFVICNDIFAWACADAEELPFKEIGNLFAMHTADPKWGSAKWCAKRRNQKPQPPVIADMKADGAWDEEMERLGENTQDAETQALFASLKKPSSL